MNEQTLSKSNVQNSTKLSNMIISKDNNQGFPESNNQGSPKSNGKNNNQGSPKSNVQALPEKTGNQGSPKANVRVLSPVTRDDGPPKNNEHIVLSKSNKISQGTKNKRRRNKGSGKKDNAENQHNSHCIKPNVSDEVIKAESSMNDQMIVTSIEEDNRDKHMGNQSGLVEIEADPSSNGQSISVNNLIPLLEKYEDIDNKEPQSTTTEEDNKHTDVTAAIKQDKSRVERQITKDRVELGAHVQSTHSNSLSFVRVCNKKAIEETNSSVAQHRSIKDTKENVQESQQENQLDFSIAKKTEVKKIELVSSKELSSKAEEESNATTDEASPSEITTFVKRFMELKMTENEKGNRDIFNPKFFFFYNLT
jgi:hypothetical protein